jgi:hypothetical protein
MRWGWACSTNDGEETVQVIGGKAIGKGSLGKRRRRWVDNIEMDFGGRGWGDVYWIELAQDTGSVEGSYA